MPRKKKEEPLNPDVLVGAAEEEAAKVAEKAPIITPDRKEPTLEEAPTRCDETRRKGHPTTMQIEREIRRYVKSSGGFRKGLSQAKKDYCMKWMEKINRKEVAWDKSIIVPGIDKPTVSGMTVTD